MGSLPISGRTVPVVPASHNSPVPVPPTSPRPVVPPTSVRPTERLQTATRQGQAVPEVSLFCEQTEQIVVSESLKVVRDDGSKEVLKRSVPLARQALTHSGHLSQRAALRASQGLAASVPLVGSAVSVLGARDDNRRAAQEKQAQHPWAARAFQASAHLNAFDAALGTAAGVAAATGYGLPAAAVLEMVGWASTAAGFALGVSGEYFSLKKR